MTCLLRSVSWQVWLAAKTFVPTKIISVDTIVRPQQFHVGPPSKVRFRTITIESIVRPRLKPNPVHWKAKFLEAIYKGFSKLQLCAITLTSQKPARLSRLTKTRATAFMTMRCRYSSSLSGHSYFERLGTGE